MPWPAVVALVLAVSVPSAGAASSDPAAQRRALERNRVLWARQHVSDYRFRLRVRCFCPSSGQAVTITVRHGRARGANGFERRLDTIPELFQAIRQALDDPQAGDVSVHYDVRRGFPRTASIDRIKNAIDDEVGWAADRFRAL